MEGKKKAKPVFTEEEARELARLLKKVARNNYLFPDEESFRALHEIRSMWALELVIWKKKSPGEKEILLVRYSGGAREFRGLWHIPGGYDVFLEPDFQAVCSKIAKRELGMNVKYVRIVGEHKWKPEEHPYGRPLSLYIQCEPLGKIEETKEVRFFGVGKLPKRLVKPHRRFLKSFLRKKSSYH